MGSSRSRDARRGYDRKAGRGRPVLHHHYYDDFDHYDDRYR